MLRGKLNAVLLGAGCTFAMLLVMFKIHESRSAIWSANAEDIVIDTEGCKNCKRTTRFKDDQASYESYNSALFKKLDQLESQIAALPQKPRPSMSQNRSTAEINANHERLESEFAAWVKSYKAPNPRHQDFCMKFLTQQDEGASQCGQDIFIFFNLFKYWPMQGRKGFYVDSGTNDAVIHSNTYFFDVCLGWPGLCVEPNEEYHHGINTERTCTLIPECISNQETTVSFHKNGGSGKVLGGTGTTKCTTLEKMLKRSVNPNQEEIDLWSLDVEGHEMTVLSSVDLKRIPVRALLVEDFWVNLRDLDYLLYKNGYKKLQPLAIDSLYTPKDLEGPLEIWYPKTFFKHIEFHQEWRKKPDLPLPLICA